MDRIEAHAVSPQVTPLTPEASALLEQLFRLHHQHLVRYIAAHINHGTDAVLAEDLAQDVWADFARYPSRPITAPEDAFNLVARRGRQAIARYYRRRANGTCEETHDWTDALASRRLPVAPPADTDADVDALALLTPAQAVVIKLKAQGLSDLRIARRLGRSETAIRKRKAAGRRTLRASLAMAG